jgi:hypothetical protein
MFKMYCRGCILQGDGNVVQAALKYKLMAAIQHNSFQSINAKHSCDYTKDRESHAML